MRIAPVDWLILGIGFAFFLGWAIYLNGKIRSVADFLLSGRKVRVWLGLSAGIAGEMGLFAIVSLCEQGFLHGFSFVAVNLLSISITLPLFGIFGFGIQRFRATKAMSVPQYLEMRYSRHLRIVAGGFNCLAGVIQLCAIPIASAHFIRVLMGAPEVADLAGMHIRSDWLILLLFLVCPLIFTFLGGYLALIVIDFFQAILIITVLTIVLFLAVDDVGLQNYWSRLETAHGAAGLNPFAADAAAYGWQWFLWLNVMTILLQFSYGPYLQKYASMDKPRTVSLSYLLGQLLGVNKALIVIALGVGALAAVGPTIPIDAATSGITASEWPRAATPYYLAHLVPPVLLGFLLLGLLFAEVAVTEQYMLSWATSIVNDCYTPFLKKPLDPRAHIRAVRSVILAMCVLFFLYGLVYRPTTTLWDYMWTLATVIGGTGIVVMLGMYWKRASTTAAWAALAVCWTLPLVDVIGRQVLSIVSPATVFPVEPRTTGLVTYALATALMVIVSLASRGPTKYWDLGAAVRAQNDADRQSRKKARLA